LIEALVGGATQKEIRQQIDTIKGNKKGDTAPAKPKRVYRTAHRATVIVQATGKQLTNQQCLDALREALNQASS
jgi:hypothetical protein